MLKALHSAQGLCLSEEGRAARTVRHNSPEEALPAPARGCPVQDVFWCPRGQDRSDMAAGRWGPHERHVVWVANGGQGVGTLAEPVWGEHRPTGDRDH